MTAAFDHLVVAARSLDEGVDWCVYTLGVAPDPGGRHSLMGTHNRVLSIAGPDWPLGYLEIIAVDPDASPPGRRRWYDLDEPSLQDALSRGPRLVHWVMRCDDIDARCRRLAAAGIDAGRVHEVERPSEAGPLRWRISVRDDGARLAGGALPTLIQWAGRHPAESLPHRGVSLLGLAVAGLPPPAVACCAAPGVAHLSRGAPVVARLATPLGEVRLASPSVADRDT